MRPIFIGGCGRSGTTLLGSMLGAHPDAVTVPESQFKALLLPPAAEPFDLAAAATALAAHWRLRLWGLNLDAGTIGRWNASDAAGLLNCIVARYAETHGRASASVWIDHTPENLFQALRLQRLYPEAKFIHIVRDGRGVAASVLGLDWGPNTIVEAGPWWAGQLAACLAVEAHLAGRVRRVRYEALVAEPEKTLRDLCEFVGLTWNSEMLSGAGLEPRPYTAAQHALVGRPAEAGRAQAWREVLSRRQIELFESATGDLLPALGYPLETGCLDPRRSFYERASMAATGLVRRYIINPRRRRRREAAIR